MTLHRTIDDKVEQAANRFATDAGKSIQKFCDTPQDTVPENVNVELRHLVERRWAEIRQTYLPDLTKLTPDHAYALTAITSKAVKLAPITAERYLKSEKQITECHHFLDSFWYRLICKGGLSMGGGAIADAVSDTFIFFGVAAGVLAGNAAVRYTRRIMHKDSYRELKNYEQAIRQEFVRSKV
jgi:hypothetical protein